MHSWDAAKALCVLADEDRLVVLSALACGPEEGMSAARLALRCSVSRRHVRAHLDQLAKAGFVACKRVKQHPVWRIETQRVEALLGFLTRRLTPRTGQTAARRCKPKSLAAKPFKSLRGKLATMEGAAETVALLRPVAVREAPKHPPKLSEALMAAALAAAEAA